MICSYVLPLFRNGNNSVFTGPVSITYAFCFAFIMGNPYTRYIPFTDDRNEILTNLFSQIPV